jgi:hypothetical protein
MSKRRDRRDFDSRLLSLAPPLPHRAIGIDVDLHFLDELCQGLVGKPAGFMEVVTGMPPVALGDRRFRPIREEMESLLKRLERRDARA